MEHVELGDNLLSAAQEPLRPAIAASASQSHLLAGRMYLFDLRDHPSAYSHLREALDAAQKADDTDLAAAVLAHLALAAVAAGNEQTARDRMRDALAFARRSSPAPRLEAWLGAVQAEIEAFAGNTTTAMQLIQEAEGAVGSNTQGPDWLDWLTPHRLATLKANILLAAGRIGDARTTLENVLQLLPQEAKKQRSILYADLAAIALADHDPDSTRDLLLKALDEIGSNGYQAPLNRVRQVRADLGDRPGLNRIDDRLASWTSTISQVG